MTATIAEPGSEQARQGPYINLTEHPADNGSTTWQYRDEVFVPYWLEPGTYAIWTGCPLDDESPGIRLEPAQFDVVSAQADGAPWEAWRPLSGPRVEPLPDSATPDRGGYEIEVADGTVLNVTAECRGGLSGDGARFVVWEERANDAGFVSKEFLVQDEDIAASAESTTISALITIQSTDYHDPVPGEGLLTISAICTPTSTPFHPDAEPPIEQARLVVVPV